MIHRLLSAALCGLLACMPVLGHAQYPERPVKIVVPFAAGGNIDLTARAISGGMAEAASSSWSSRAPASASPEAAERCS